MKISLFFNPRRFPGIASISLVVILIISTFTASNLRWGKNRWKAIFGVDAKGYYSYLPAIFIYHDLNFNFYDSIENKHFKADGIYDYREQIGSKWIDKYYCGTAICELPFFLTVYFAGNFSGNIYDGYEKPFAIAISIAALFFLFLGLLYLRKFIKLYGVDKWNSALVLFASVFGTNMLYYVAIAPGFSHVYSFAMVSVFLFSVKKYFLSLEKRHLIKVALSLGIIVLIRPVNIMIVLSIPFLAASFNNLKVGIVKMLNKKMFLLLSLGVFIVTVSIQLIIYKIATGEFFVYSYTTESFKFSDFNLFRFLFSYRKGLFLYSPVLFAALVSGLFYMWKKSRYEVIMYLYFFIITSYVLSSWWMWWYGGSFGCRVFIEFIPLLTLLLGIALINMRPILLKNLFVSLIIALMLFTQLQLYQYRIGYIHWDSMDYERYWDVFLKVDILLN